MFFFPFYLLGPRGISVSYDFKILIKYLLTWSQEQEKKNVRLLGFFPCLMWHVPIYKRWALLLDRKQHQDASCLLVLPKDSSNNLVSFLHQEGLWMKTIAILYVQHGSLLSQIASIFRNYKLFYQCYLNYIHKHSPVIQWGLGKYRQLITCWQQVRKPKKKKQKTISKKHQYRMKCQNTHRVKLINRAFPYVIISNHPSTLLFPNTNIGNYIFSHCSHYN